jgi:hypothetical protein
VSTTQGELVAKFAPGVVDTGGKLAAGVVDTKPSEQLYQRKKLVHRKIFF